MAKKLINKGYTKSKLRSTSQKELEEFLTKDEIKEIKEKIKRKPISKHTITRLIDECDWKCCICFDIKLNQPVIIHHIKSYSKTQDNRFENLVVLCLKHHGDAHISSNIAQPPLPIELLKQKKKEWMEHVKCYKRLFTQSKTAIIHYSKAITIISEEKIKKDFYRTNFKDIIEISCSYNLLNELDKWAIEQKKQEKIVKEVLENEKIIKEFMIFSIHRIPLVIHLGFLLGDGFPIEVFQFDRNGGRDSWVWKEIEKLKIEDNLSIDDSNINLGNYNEHFIIIIEISGKIRKSDIFNVINEYGGSFTITANYPSQLWLKYKEQVAGFKSLFYKVIAQIKRQNQSARKFHLFYYGPTPLAFIIGQAINKTILPEVYLYNYNGSKYKMIFKI